MDFAGMAQRNPLLHCTKQIVADATEHDDRGDGPHDEYEGHVSISSQQMNNGRERVAFLERAPVWSYPARSARFPRPSTGTNSTSSTSRAHSSQKKPSRRSRTASCLSPHRTDHVIKQKLGCHEGLPYALAGKGTCQLRGGHASLDRCARYPQPAPAAQGPEADPIKRRMSGRVPRQITG